jgi:hypothetical protein
MDPKSEHLVRSRAFHREGTNDSLWRELYLVTLLKILWLASQIMVLRQRVTLDVISIGAKQANHHSLAGL